MATFMVYRNLHIIFATKDNHLQRRGCIQMLCLTPKDLFQTVIYSRPIQTTAGVHMIRQPFHEWVCRKGQQCRNACGPLLSPVPVASYGKELQPF